MNDTTIQTADVGSTPPPQTGQTEVTIPEQSPDAQHGSTGVQAPDKSPERIAHDRAVGRREAIERAFAKSALIQGANKKAAEDLGKTDGEDRGKPEAKAQEKQPAKEPQPREKGKFVARTPEGDEYREGVKPAPVKHAPLADDAPYREPPPRFSEAAKADWNGVPESVRGAVHQAHQQMERGIQQYRGAAEAFHELREFHEMAQRTGTSLKEALTNYTSIENRLRSDLFGGVDLIINNLRLPGRNGGRYNVYDFARDVLRLSPEQHRLVQHQNHAQAQNMQIGKLYQQVERLANGFQQLQYQQEFKSTRSEIDKFADAHPGFDDRLDLIKQEMDHGWPLQAAYERAMKLRPGRSGAPRAAQTRDTTAQTRSEEVDRSISGAPNGGTPSTRARDPKKRVTNREALTNAMRKVRSGV